MNFFKDLKEDLGSTMVDFEGDDNQMVDTLGDTDSLNFDDYDLSDA